MRSGDNYLDMHRVVQGEADWGKGRRRLTDRKQPAPVGLTQNGTHD